MRPIRSGLDVVLLITALALSAPTFAVAQSVTGQELKPDLRRALAANQNVLGVKARKNSYTPRNERSTELRRSAPSGAEKRLRAVKAPASLTSALPSASTAILSGTSLSRILHTSQLSLTSAAGSNEQFVDRNGDLIADERTTLDNSGGSFDIAVGHTGARYEVYSATLNSTLVGVLVVALDTNGDFLLDSSSTFNLQRDYALASAAAVVTGTSKTGREFVIVSSSGYYNSADPKDPNNEPSPGVLLLVRDLNTGGFDNSLTRELTRVGDNKLYNANALALLPNNDLLIADFHSDELRIVRDTNSDGLPDTLDPLPYYSYRYSNDAPLDIAVNSRGVVFSHSAGDDIMLALYDDNGDGQADRDEEAVVGLSIDNNLFLHGMSVDRLGNVYVIEDATGSADGGNGGVPRVDAFPDHGLNGFLKDGAIFALVDDSATQGLSGVSFGALVANPINDAQFFVNQHYLDFLSRAADPGGLAYWTNQITQCGTDDLCLKAKRIGVSAAFFIELEFQDTGAFVYRFYKASYGRKPSFAEFSSDRSRVIGGTNLEASKDAFANDWVRGAAFQQVYPPVMTPEQFVNKLFDTAGLVPYSGQRQQLINDMQGGKSRALVLREVTDIGDFKSREYNPSFVLMQYFGYLVRDPDQGGYDFWLNVLNNREPNNYRGMVCSFITSREYQERFGLLLRRTNVDCQ